jgi:hypothetical protein
LVVNHVRDVYRKAGLPVDQFDAEEVQSNYAEITEYIEQLIINSNYAADTASAELLKALKLPANAGYSDRVKVFAVAMKQIKTTPVFKNFAAAVKVYSNLNWKSNVVQVHTAFMKLVESYVALHKIFPYASKQNLKELLTAYNKAKIALQSSAAGLPKAAAVKIVNAYGFTDKDFPRALKSEHEVCILGNYIALNADDYYESIKDYFVKSIKKKAPAKKAVAKKK